jgi:hypothetical protein
LHAGFARTKHIILEMHKNTMLERWRRGNRSEQIAFRKLLTGDKVIELRILGSPAYKIKCKRENELKIRTVFGRNKEMICI